MDIKKCLLTNNLCYKTGTGMTVKGITVHSTGADNPNLARYVQPNDGILGVNKYGNSWNVSGLELCCHAFIGLGADGNVYTYQTLPWNMRGWHGGRGTKGSVNDGYIGFEICEDALADKVYFDRVYKEAVSLCAYLCVAYGITPEKPYLISHKEGNALGIASAHGDPDHWFAKFGKSMDTLRADVTAAICTPEPANRFYRVQAGAYNSKKSADELAAKMQSSGFGGAFVTEVTR